MTPRDRALQRHRSVPTARPLPTPALPTPRLTLPGLCTTLCLPPELAACHTIVRLTEPEEALSRAPSLPVPMPILLPRNLITPRAQVDTTPPAIRTTATVATRPTFLLPRPNSRLLNSLRLPSGPLTADLLPLLILVLVTDLHLALATPRPRRSSLPSTLASSKDSGHRAMLRPLLSRAGTRLLQLRSSTTRAGRATRATRVLLKAQAPTTTGTTRQAVPSASPVATPATERCFIFHIYHGH